MADLSDAVPVIDARGKLCPAPIIEIAKAIKRVAPGAQVRLLADDPGAERDLRDWSAATRHQIVELNRGPGARIDALLLRRFD